MNKTYEVVDLEPRSRTWHLWRADGIGGSDIGPIFLGKDWPYKGTTRETIFDAKTSQRGIDLKPNWAMRRGIGLESVAAMNFADKYNVTLAPVCVQSRSVPYCRASLDGLGEMNGKPFFIEIKCLKWESHQLALIGKVPAWYLPQLQWQMLVTGFSECHYVSYCPNADKFPQDKFFVEFKVKADPAYQHELSLEARAFWVEVERWRKQGSD